MLYEKRNLQRYSEALSSASALVPHQLRNFRDTLVLPPYRLEAHAVPPRLVGQDFNQVMVACVKNARRLFVLGWSPTQPASNVRLRLETMAIS
jgi:hypothetical protein